jgi:hypothetical protein
MSKLRRATCPAFNMYAAEQFGRFSDRITRAAVIPMHPPAEAIEELDYGVNTSTFYQAQSPSGGISRRICHGRLQPL